MYYKKNLDFVALIWEDLAYQIDNIDSKKQDKMFYLRFTKIIIHHFLTKDKSISMRNRMFMHTARDDSVLGTMRFVPRHADTQVYGAILPKAMMNQALLDYVAYKTYYAIASGAEPPKLRKSQKKSDSAISSEESPSKKKSAKAKKVTATKPKLTKKKAPIKADRGKGLNVLSDVALSEAAQLKEATKRSKEDFHISQASGSGDGTDFESGVPNEQHLKTSSTDEGTEEDDDDDENDSEDESDNGDNNDDDDANDYDNQEDDDTNDDDKETDKEEEKFDDEEKIDDEEKMDEEEYDEVTKELYKDVNVNLGNEDIDMTNVDHGGSGQQNVSQESGFEQVGETYNLISFTSGFLICIQVQRQSHQLGKRSVRDKILPQAVSDFATHVIEKNVTESLEIAVLARSSSQPTSTYEAASSLSKFELTKILIDKMEKNKSYDKADYKRELYDALVKSYQTDKDLFDTYGEVFTLKRSRKAYMMDKTKFKNPLRWIRSRSKRRKSSKEAESSRDSRSKEKKSLSTSKDASQSQHKHFGKSAYVEEPGSKRYSTSVTKTKAATYEIKWIEDLVRNLWSPVTVKYDKHAYWGTSHWGPKHQHFYGFTANMSSSKDVYAIKQIIAVTRLTIMKKYDYGHLEEIEVRREDQKLYKFREGDFQRLRLQDIEDMLLLLVQQNLTNLTIDERYALNVALRMFTRRIVIQRRVEGIQLGVESYQKKLNLTKPNIFRSNLRNKTTYTAYSDQKGVIYKDQNNRNRLMHADELHKFSYGTLNDVQTALNDIAKGIRMEYPPKRKWSGLDKQRARVMVQDIDKQLYERRLMRNLKKFVGGREYRNDLRLLERTI
ncbi:hypothetical protein Tco_0132705 [Tanacetum coccineum]